MMQQPFVCFLIHILSENTFQLQNKQIRARFFLLLCVNVVDLVYCLGNQGLTNLLIVLYLSNIFELLKQ